MPYKASARPFFFPAAGRRSAIAAFHSEMFPLLLRGTTLPPHDDPFRTRGGRHPCPPIRLRQSVRGPDIEHTDRFPAHTDEDIRLRIYITAIHTVTTPAVVLNGHNLHIRTVPVRARTGNGHPKDPHGNQRPPLADERKSMSVYGAENSFFSSPRKEATQERSDSR